MEYNITLSSREIEALQIALSGTTLELLEAIERLEENNRAGINNNLLIAKHERVLELNALWLKLNNAL